MSLASPCLRITSISLSSFLSFCLFALQLVSFTLLYRNIFIFLQQVGCLALLALPPLHLKGVSCALCQVFIPALQPGRGSHVNTQHLVQARTIRPKFVAVLTLPITWCLLSQVAKKTAMTHQTWQSFVPWVSKSTHKRAHTHAHIHR